MNTIHWCSPDDVERDNLREFLDGLTEERITFQSSTELIMESDILVVACKGDRIVGVSGIRWYWLTPIGYLVVASEYQRSIYGYRLFAKGLEKAALRYPYMMAIVLNKGRTTIRLAHKLGFKPCLIHYKYHFLFRPFRWWSYLIYGVYYVFFPLLFLGFYFVRKHLRRLLQVNKIFGNIDD